MMKNLPILVVLLSVLWILVQAVGAYCGKKLSERMIRIFGSVYCLLILGLNCLILFHVLQTQAYALHLHDWLTIRGFRLTSTFYIDFTGAVFAILSSFLFWIISKFSFSYLHREGGFFRYFILITVLSLGIQLISYAGNLDIFFIGWEIIGVTSVQLIAFFQSNRRSVQNSFRALVSYRVCDVAFLAACVLLHYYDHGTDFDILRQRAFENFSHWIGLLIILATLAKSAQFPFSNWLFRAMEGPTPSSTIYYGALSIHLGPFLLLRAEPLWSQYLPLKLLIFGIGLTTVVYGSLVGRTRSDVKSSLAYSTMTQVGIIYLEISLGLSHFALFHLVCHALLRTWQFLRSSSLIHDFMESSVTRDQFHRVMNAAGRPNESKWKRKLYIHALNGFYLDALQDLIFVVPFKKITGILAHRVKVFYYGALVLLLIFLSQTYFGMSRASLVWSGLICASVFSLAGFRLRPLHAMGHLILSQSVLCLVGIEMGGIGKTGAKIQIITLVFSAPVLLFLMYRAEQSIRERQGNYIGLIEYLPKLGLIILLLGWVLVGAPGGPIQISEDIFLYKLIEISPWTNILFLICAFSNFLVFYHSYSKVFYGPSESYRDREDLILSQEIPRMSYLLIGTGIFLLVLFGMWPSLIL